MKATGNVAYIDGQNLYMGTSKSQPIWKVDLVRFRVYLRDKYNVEKAYYYLGYVQEGLNYETLYDKIQSAGFIVKFRQHNSAMLGKKKGNVDSDIIFAVMRELVEQADFGKVVLVSGDGDYKMLVDYLIEKDRFEKILFPNKKFSSSLYKKIGAKYFANLDDTDVKKKISTVKK